MAIRRNVKTEDVLELLESGSFETLTEIAQHLECAPSTISYHLRKAGVDPVTTGGLSTRPPQVPMKEDVSAAELWEHRKNRYKRKAEAKEANREAVFSVQGSEPIGLLFFGDPHVDDDGTDLELLERHAELTREVDGLYGVNLGDTTNNWVGRLARLYAEQGTTASEAWVLAEHWLRSVDWLFMVGGNHDAWSGSGDPIKWISKAMQVHYAADAVRARLKFSNGEDFTIHARHTFPGHSQWNVTHGVAKAAKFGDDADILIAGHKHVSGYQVVKHPLTGKISHAIQVASYKIYDRYAEQLGLPDQHISPCAVTVLNPKAKRYVNRVQMFWCPEDAADYLTYLRQGGAS